MTFARSFYPAPQRPLMPVLMTSPMLTDIDDDPLADLDTPLGWDPPIAAPHSAPAIAHSDWLTDNDFPWPMPNAKLAPDALPFSPATPVDAATLDQPYATMQWSPQLEFQSPSAVPFPGPSLYDDPASVQDIELYGSPWASPIPATDAPADLPAPQALRPLVLAHRTPALSASLPISPLRFLARDSLARSAPAEFSPMSTLAARRYSTDDGPRKRKRSSPTPEPAPPQRSELHPPKQAPSAWQVFFADWLEEHRARHPRQKLNVAQAAKEAGAVYHGLRPEARDRLKQRAQSAKEDREREVAEWKRRLTPDDIRRENAFRAAQRRAGKSRRGNLKDPNAPKKPLSAYFMFLQRIRASPQLVLDVFGTETETTKQSVLAAAKWRALSDAEKKPFLLQAEQEKIQYEAARRAYEDGFAGTQAGAAYRATGAMGADGSRTSVLGPAGGGAQLMFAMDPLDDEEHDPEHEDSDAIEDA